LWDLRLILWSFGFRFISAFILFWTSAASIMLRFVQFGSVEIFIINSRIVQYFIATFRICKKRISPC
jgi:hypothetical protein